MTEIQERLIQAQLDYAHGYHNGYCGFAACGGVMYTRGVVVGQAARKLGWEYGE